MALFKSTHDALRFAYNFNGDNTVSAHWGGMPKPTGRGLGGLDGAGEAGNIKRVVESLGGLVTAWAVANYAPNSFPCSCRRPCCKGWRMNDEWESAVLKMSGIAFDKPRKVSAMGFFDRTIPKGDKDTASKVSER